MWPMYAAVHGRGINSKLRRRAWAGYKFQVAIMRAAGASLPAGVGAVLAASAQLATLVVAGGADALCTNVADVAGRCGHHIIISVKSWVS